MSTKTPGPGHEDDHQQTDAISAEAWLRAPVTLTLPRWMLLAAGLVVLVLFLVALD